MSHDLNTSSMRGVTSEVFKGTNVEKPYDSNTSSMRGFTPGHPAQKPQHRVSPYTEDISSVYVPGDLRLAR